MAFKIGGNTIIDNNRNLLDYVEKINAIGNTTTTTTINLANGTFVTATLATSPTTFVFNAGASSTGAIVFTLALTNDGTAGRTVNWPSTVRWPDGVAPTRTTTANRTDVYTFYTLNGGTLWFGQLSLYNYPIS